MYKRLRTEEGMGGGDLEAAGDNPIGSNSSSRWNHHEVKGS